MEASKAYDRWSILVIVITFGLFVTALFVKGLTHDAFLEAGVLLVSIKLILMAKRNAETEGRVEGQLTEIKEMLRRKDGGEVDGSGRGNPSSGSGAGK